MNDNWLDELNKTIADLLEGTPFGVLAEKLNDIRDEATGKTDGKNNNDDNN